MTCRAVPTLVSLIFTFAAVAEQRDADGAQADSSGAHRYLEPGSWVVTEAHVRSNGAPVTIKRKLSVSSRGEGGGERAVEESRWVADGFGPAAAARPLARVDRRTFDELCPKPQSVQPDRVLTVGPKRYVCRVETYAFRDEAAGWSTAITLWRDKSAGTQLPPRTVTVNGSEMPLPADALQAEISTDGADTSTRSKRVVTALAAPLRVNGQTLSCVVETIQTNGTQAGKPVELARQEWYCHDLPGERLRTLTCGTIDGAEVRSEVAVVDFHVAKPEAEAAASSGGFGGGGRDDMPTILPKAE